MYYIIFAKMSAEFYFHIINNNKYVCIFQQILFINIHISIKNEYHEYFILYVQYILLYWFRRLKSKNQAMKKEA